MAWSELTEKRTRCSRTYKDSTNPGKRVWDGSMAPIHYQSTIDSGDYDTEVNLTPTRVDNAQFDGWRVTSNNWHYAIGKDIANHGQQDGWIGFGGRKGQNWFKYRLVKIGYFHWPTKEWEDVGGAPDYDRLNLTRSNKTLTIGPNNDQIVAETEAYWSDIWSTPNGGAVDIRWRANGGRIKEEIIVNQEARGWIETNAPPSTPASQTWFGFIFNIDWSDISKIYSGGTLRSEDDDFTATDCCLELKDSLERLLAFMPLSSLFVDDGEENQTELLLTKRFLKEGSNHILMVGARVSDINQLPDGDLVFDPTIDEQVGASSDDCYSVDPGSTYFSTSSDRFNAGVFDATFFDYLSAARFTTVNVPKDATIDTAYLTLRCSTNFGGGNCQTKLDGEAVDDAATFSNWTDYTGRSRTTAAVDWDITTIWQVDNDYTSAEIKTVIQEIVNRSGWVANNDLVIFWEDDGSSTLSNNLRRAYSYDGSTTYAPKLHIEYTVFVEMAGTCDVTSSITGDLNVDKSIIGQIDGQSSFTGNITKQTYSLTGVTKDNDGNVLGSCQCYLIRDNQDNTMEFVDHVVSNASTGVYSFTGIENGGSEYMVIAWKDDAPRVYDVTDHVLQPTLET